MTILRVTILLLALAGLTAPSFAQIGGQGGPMDITADRLETFDAERRAMFSGNVDAAQGEANLRSDALEVFFAPRSGNATGTGASWGEIDRVIATGDVFYVTPNEIARGERAVYQLTAQTIVMTGGVTLRRGENVIEGDCLVVDLETNNSQINAPACRGEAPAGTDQNTGRVRGVFFPATSGSDDDDAGNDADAEG
ncbi:LptA/OstA family protein [Hyphobacterium sp.]|uniref:LptA/OstA family protein n=1 Tax=Hyphobacterium sp. TaxID=2004662 RepID=UPI00374A7642